MRVLAVENMAHSELGQVGVALGEAGAEIDLRRPFLGERLPETIDDHDAIVVFGGEQSALDDALHPYLPALLRLMRGFSDAGKAVLGICLGSQLLARAHGAKNLLGQRLEFGWHPVELTAEGRRDPVLRSAGEAFPIFQWHTDTFTLPDGAIHLATNAAVANQAFRIGRAAYGMQFHFEADSHVVERWNTVFKDQIDGLDPHWLEHHPQHAARHAAKSDAAGLCLARAWVAQIRAGEARENDESRRAGALA